MSAKIIAIDVETPNHRNDKICSIGISVIENGIVTENKEFLVNPECEFDKKNIEIHGIRPSDVYDAPTFDVLWKDIGDLLLENLVVAHNATFDLCVLKKTLAAYRIEEAFLYYVCTMNISRSALKSLENYKLPTLCEYYGISLSHHDAGSDSLACAEILCKLIEEGIDVNDYVKAYSFEENNTIPHESHSRKSKKTLALEEMTKILSAISSDGMLTNAEIECLQNWLKRNSALQGNYPYDKIYKTLGEVLSDGVIDRSEIDFMLDLFQKVSDPVKDSSCGYREFDIAGKSVCLSGEFERGEKKEIIDLLVSHGATILDSVSKKTDILLVGGMGNTSWVAGNYGTKVKKAMEMREKGIDIKIIREEDFFATLEV